MDGAILVFTGFLLVGVVLALLLVTVPRWLAPRLPTDLKSTTYECGEIPTGEPWIRFRIEYYVVALVFVIFDVEAALLYPWATIARKLGVAGLVEMAVFVAILALGLAYAWRKGALKWV
jgi:NADH-quinone oxidoreductase subunit A